METKSKENGQVKVVNTVQADKTPKFVAGNPINKVSVIEPKAEDQSPTEQTGFVNVNKLAADNEPTKKELKATIVERMAEQREILERHIKLGDELARKIKHRDNLTGIIETLDKFELNLKNEADGADSNFYQGCILTIKDDNGETFTTKNPTIIKGVAEQVGTLCSDKLKEVETDIVNLIPA